MAEVREQSLCPRPTVLHRQVALIWNEAALDPALGEGFAEAAQQDFHLGLSERIAGAVERRTGRHDPRWW